MNKSELKFSLDNGRIIIIIKVPDHQPPHVHAYMKLGEEDVITIIGDPERVNIPGYLSDKKLDLCQKWILEGVYKV